MANDKKAAAAGPALQTYPITDGNRVQFYVLGSDNATGSAGAFADLAKAIKGARHFIFTDISRDGTLSGPNLESLRDLVAVVDADVIASGGIATLDDLRGAASAGATGVIVGRALYDGRIDLAEAIATAGAGVVA